MPAKFTLNRIMGGQNAVRFAALLGVERVMRRREPVLTTNEDNA